jgi:hypothetical protein
MQQRKYYTYYFRPNYFYSQNTYGNFFIETHITSLHYFVPLIHETYTHFFCRRFTIKVSTSMKVLPVFQTLWDKYNKGVYCMQDPTLSSWVIANREATQWDSNASIATISIPRTILKNCLSHHNLPIWEYEVHSNLQNVQLAKLPHFRFLFFVFHLLWVLALC